MTCLIQPKEFNKAQTSQCRQCKWVSGKKVWCCKWGLWVDGRDKPAGKIIQNSKKIQKPPTIAQIVEQYKKVKAARKNDGIILQQDYIRKRLVCSKCYGGWKCPHRCCYMGAKWALISEKCPEGKW